MAVKVRKESQPRIRLKGANSSTVDDGILLGTGDGNRTSMTFTATAEPVIVIPEGPVTNVQLEVGSFATSYIPNNATSGTVTRSADIASIPVSAFGYNEEAGTWFMEWDTADTDNTFSKYVLSSGNDARVMYNNTGSPAWYAFDGSTASTYTQPTGITLDGSSIKATYAEDDNGASVAHTGFLGAGSGSSDLLPNYNPIYGWSIGNLNGANYFLNGHIKSLKYYPRRLTDAQLQTLTS